VRENPVPGMAQGPLGREEPLQRLRTQVRAERQEKKQARGGGGPDSGSDNGVPIHDGGRRGMRRGRRRRRRRILEPPPPVRHYFLEENGFRNLIFRLKGRHYFSNIEETKEGKNHLGDLKSMTSLNINDVIKVFMTSLVFL